MNQKGITPIVIILIIVGVLAVGSGIWYWQNQKKKTTVEQPISISELFSDFCNPSAPCGRKMDCEDKTAKIYGYVDYDNVSEKGTDGTGFLMTNEKGDKNLPIAVASDNNPEIFKKIYENNTLPRKKVFVSGIIKGFDMSVMDSCSRGIDIIVGKTNDIIFEH